MFGYFAIYFRTFSPFGICAASTNATEPGMLPARLAAISFEYTILGPAEASARNTLPIQYCLNCLRSFDRSSSKSRRALWRRALGSAVSRGHSVPLPRTADYRAGGFGRSAKPRTMSRQRHDGSSDRDLGDPGKLSVGDSQYQKIWRLNSCIIRYRLGSFGMRDFLDLWGTANDGSSALALLFLQVTIHRIEIVVELFSICIAHFPNSLDNWIFPRHSILQ